MTGRSIGVGLAPRVPAASPTGVAPAGVAGASPLVPRLATWLLVTVALDLIVTRIVVRLAIFVPKGEPWATVSSWLGGVGAVTDTLVPIVSLLLLGGLMLAAGHGTRADRILAAGCALVAAAGLALVALSPPPVVALVVDGVVALVAIGAVATWRPARSVPGPARLGVWSLSGALAAAAVVRMVDASAAVGGDAGSIAAGVGAWIAFGGQWAFVAGAGLVGVAGIRAWPAGTSRRGALASLVAGVVIGSLVVAMAWRAPEHAGQLIIWSTGLTGAVPIIVLAGAVGLAVAGVPGLTRPAPLVALGASIVLLAGYSLAASGLVLAGLLGLLVARHDAAPRQSRR